MRGLFAALLLAGCAAPTPPLPLPPDPPPVPVHIEAPPVKPPPRSKSPFRMSPTELILAADQARGDAAGYVSSKNSNPETNDRLTILTTTMLNAVRAMGYGHRRSAVKAAQKAVFDLRQFLAHKEESPP